MNISTFFGIKYPFIETDGMKIASDELEYAIRNHPNSPEGFELMEEIDCFLPEKKLLRLDEKNNPDVYVCLNRKYRPLLQRDGIYGLKHPKEMSREGYSFYSWTISKLENMLYYQIKNYEDFKNGSDLQQGKNGVISRKNKILLGHLKNPLLLRYCLTHNDYSLLHISDMADLQKKVTEAVKESGRNDGKLTTRWN